MQTQSAISARGPSEGRGQRGGSGTRDGFLIATPIKVMAFRQRYDTWLTTKIPLLAVILRPWHRVESQLTTLGAGAWIVRAWGIVAGLLAAFLLAVLLVSLINPCP